MDLDTLLPASFRGIELLCSESKIDTGRKTVTHEFPNSDRRFVEDLGLKNETITLKVIIPSEDYYVQRDLLKLALEQDGTGLLIHPWYGPRTVAVTQVSIMESTSEFGKCVFDITFEVTQDLLSPLGTGSLGDLSAVLPLVYTALHGFSGSSWSTKEVPHFGTREVLSSMQNVFTAVKSQFSTVTSNATDRDSIQSEKKALDSQIQVLGQLYFSGTELFTALDRYISNIFAFSPDMDRAFRALEQLLSDSFYTPESGSYGEKTLNLLTSLKVLTKSIAFANLCRVSLFKNYSTLNDVEMVRSSLEDHFSALQSLVETSEINLDEIRVLHSETDQILLQNFSTLPEILKIRVRNRSATLLSYALYGVTDEAEDIRLRNRVLNRDPVSLDGEVDLKEPSA